MARSIGTISALTLGALEDMGWTVDWNMEELSCIEVSQACDRWLAETARPPMLDQAAARLRRLQEPPDG